MSDGRTRRRPPTPAELSHWLRVAAPASASGVYRWRVVREAPESLGWFGYASEVPAPVFVPPDVDVSFWHAAPGSWRLEVAGELLAVADGERALVVDEGRVHVGAVLLAPRGPARLLQPGRPQRGPYEEPALGEVHADERLGRRCWRWVAPDATWWLDHETGIALAYADADIAAELLELQLDCPIDPALFVPPPELLEQGESVTTRRVDDWTPLPDGREIEREQASWQPEFTVAWWPYGSSAYPESGDPTVPEALLVLLTGGDPEPRFWLGVAPQPRPAPTKAGARTRTWDGDGWSFALCWRDELPDELVDRVVASVPSAWAP